MYMYLCTYLLTYLDKTQMSQGSHIKGHSSKKETKVTPQTHIEKFKIFDLVVIYILD